MEFESKFSKGMQKDLSKTLFSPETYVDALNFSLVTDLGLNTGILRNTKGNELFITLPATSNVVEITQGFQNGSTTVTILTENFLVNNTISTWRADLAAAINANLVLQTAGLIAHFNNERVVVYSGLNSAFQTTTSFITASSLGPTIIAVDMTYLQPVGCLIMGWGSIRDDIFIFSTDNANVAPVNNQGQIWKLTYDKYTFTPALELIYHGRLNFSLAHPIPNPGGVIGSYEIPNVQKLYFTDNYNRPKNINTVDTNLFANLASDLESTPNQDFGAPLITEIVSGGSLPPGVYQYSYRLKSTTGGTSNCTPPSNPFPLTVYSENGSYMDYQGYLLHPILTATNKAIKGRFYNVDTSYDRIEIIAMYRVDLGAVPDFNIISDEPIPDTGIVEFVHSGNEIPVNITLDEFTSTNIVFDRVKAITTKNSLMFYGNVTHGDFDVDFDARAFRYDRTFATYPHNILPDIDDDINLNQDPTDPDAYLFQANGVIHGGSGANVSYKFVQPSNTNPFRTTFDSNYPPFQQQAPYGFVLPQISSYDLDQNVNTLYNNTITSTVFNSSKSPFVQSVLRGYKRDETYRFGIVFYSKKGEASYVHWIGDIRIPHTWIIDGTTGVRTMLYPLVTEDTNVNYYAHPMGVEFTVDISNIQDLISGYQIVRVKREQEDKTILGQGAFYMGMETNALVPDHMTVPNDVYSVTANQAVSRNFASLNCPDFLLGQSPQFIAGDQVQIQTLLGGNQTLMVMDDANVEALGNSSPINLLTKVVYKNYNSVSGFINAINPADPTTAQGLFQPDIGLNIASPNIGGAWNYVINLQGVPYTVYNLSVDNSAAVDHYSAGSNTLLLGFGATPAAGTGTFANFSSLNAGWSNGDDVTLGTAVYRQTPRLYLADYKRTLINQYGGNTLSSRSNNEFISTGNFVINDGNTTAYTTMVFGGDTYVCLFDNVKQFALNIPISYVLNDPTADHSTTAEDTVWVCRLFPVESSVNVEWRRNPNNRLPNVNDFPSAMFGVGVDFSEDFDIEAGYFSENDFITYKQRPVPYLANNTFDVRIHKSQVKYNGELTDSWNVFKEDEYKDAHSAYGQINQLLVHQDRLLFWQDRAFGIASVNERSVVIDQVGAETGLGSITPLSRVDYIKTPIGSKHQFAFCQSPDSVFFLDINTKNVYKLDNLNPVSLSVVKGLSSFFSNNLGGLIQTNDNPYLNMGATMTYDARYNQAYITVRDTLFNDGISRPVIVNVGAPGTGTLDLDYTRGGVPDCIEPAQSLVLTYTLNGVSITEVFTVINMAGNIITVQYVDTLINDITIANSITDLSTACQTLVSYTVSYNDLINAWVSFHSFTPPVYVNDNIRLFTPSNLGTNLYMHEMGDFSTYYGITYPSTVKFIVNPEPKVTKIFDNYQLTTEVLNNGVNVGNNTFDSIRVYNDNQNSDFQLFSNVAKRIERSWNVSQLRNRVIGYAADGSVDPLSPASISLTNPMFAPRMRDKYLYVDLIYNNTDNYEFNFNTFKTQLRVSP